MIVRIIDADNGTHKWHCTACGHKWFPRDDDPRQLRCPNRRCRKLANYRGGGRGPRKGATR